MRSALVFNACHVHTCVVWYGHTPFHIAASRSRNACTDANISPNYGVDRARKCSLTNHDSYE
jgi:hypothetical protein